MPPVSQKSAPKKLIEYTHMFTYMRKTGIMASWSNGYRVWLQARRLGVRTSLKPFFSAKRFLHVIFIFINIKNYNIFIEKIIVIFVLLFDRMNPKKEPKK